MTTPERTGNEPEREVVFYVHLPDDRMIDFNGVDGELLRVGTLRRDLLERGLVAEPFEIITEGDAQPDDYEFQVFFGRRLIVRHPVPHARPVNRWPVSPTVEAKVSLRDAERLDLGPMLPPIGHRGDVSHVELPEKYWANDVSHVGFDVALLRFHAERHNAAHQPIEIGAAVLLFLLDEAGLTKTLDDSPASDALDRPA